MNVIHAPEPEVFGVSEPWRLISRAVVDDRLTSLRALPLLGRGFLFQIGRQTKVDGGQWSACEYEPTFLVPDLVLVEHMAHEPSGVVDARGQPSSVTVHCLGREPLSVSVARDRYQGKRARVKIQGAEDLNIVAGSVLSMAQSPVVPPPASVEVGDAA